jgi:integrase
MTQTLDPSFDTTTTTPGLRPWRSQLGRPEHDVHVWEISTAGELDAEGSPLPELKRQVRGTKARAIARRLCWLTHLRLQAGLCASRLEPLDPRTTTVAQYIAEAYEAYSKREHRHTTHAVRMRNLHTHVLPVLGDLPLAKANTPRAITKLRAHLDSCVMGTATKSQVLLSLSSVLTLAADPDQQPDGVALLSKKVRIKIYKSEGVKAGQVTYSTDGIPTGHARHKRLLDDQWRALIDVCENDFERVVVGLGLLCGCRISETGARLWTDIDWENPKLHIWSSVCPETFEIVGTKNGIQGYVPLSNNMLGWLAAWRKQQGGSSLYILGGTKTRPYRHRASVAWLFRRIVLRARLAGAVLPRLENYHALRHTFCSRLADAGLPPQVIQRLARHRSINTTYGYITPGTSEIDRAARLLDF